MFQNGKLISTTTRNLMIGATAITICGSASAGLVEWKTSADGAGADFSEINVTSGGVAETRDIGLYDETTGGGVTYELIVNGGNNGVSDAILGVDVAGQERGALKTNQWNNTGLIGITEFGNNDFSSTQSFTENVDTHIVFVNDGTDTTIYVDGSQVDVITGLNVEIEGEVGVGAFYTGAIFKDVFNGSVLALAVYDNALTSGEIASNYNAFVPEPSSLALIALGGIVVLRRRRNAS